MSGESFGARLRHERERRQIALASIAANTKISAALLEGLERDDVSRWPSGIFRRSFIRAYAKSIGLEPESIVGEFLERFPDPAHPSPPTETNRQATSEITSKPPHRMLRLTFSDTSADFTPGPLVSKVSRRWGAIAWDAGVLITIAVGFFLVLDDFWMPLGVSMSCYYLGSILVLGNTPGVCLFAACDRRDDVEHPGSSASAPAVGHAGAGSGSRRHDATMPRLVFGYDIPSRSQRAQGTGEPYASPEAAGRREHTAD